MENEQIKSKFPVGMIIILILIGWGAVSLLLSMFKHPMSQLGPILLTGAGAIVVNLVILGILATIFYGILKRMMWARKLTIGWYIVSVIILVINFVSFLGNNTMYNSYYQKILPPEAYSLMTPAVITGSLVFALGFGFGIGIIVIIYVIRKKDFFTN